MLQQLLKPRMTQAVDWRGFVALFLGTLVGGCAAIYVFILLIDPYGVVPFSLPLDRHIVSISQRFMYPQVVRSKRFDSLVVGTSTSRLLDPELLNRTFNAHFANLAMDSATAWEQQEMINYFLRQVGSPKVLIVGIDVVWCSPDADRARITFRGFPSWLYDDNPWNDYLYVFNSGALEIAGREVGYQFGVYPERLRNDGYGIFLPPDSQYDPVRAHYTIWQGVAPPPAVSNPPLSPAERTALSFPALPWLDAVLAKLPATSVKVLAFMPVHVADQPAPGTRDAAVHSECKARIVAIAGRRGAKVIDWRIASPLTRNDANYWDRLHYRVPVATRLAEEMGPAVLEGQASDDRTYLLPLQ
jgi:hypothetical protein